MLLLLYEKTLKESMIDKKINEKESEQLKQICNHYKDIKSEIMKNTQIKVFTKTYSLMLFQNILFHQNKDIN